MILFAIAAVLMLSALFSGSEIAFISANKLGVEVKRNSGSARGQILAGFYDNPERFLSIMLVGNNIALVIFTSLMTSLMEPYLSQVFPREWMVLLAATIIITIVILFFGEYLPKTFFRLYSNTLLYLLTYPLVFFRYLLAIPSGIMTWVSNIFLKYVMRVSVAKEDQVITRLDLETFVYTKAGDEDEELEADIFKNALHLKKTKVRECMVPRTEVQHIDIRASTKELEEMFIETRHSRILITDDDIDNVVGYVHHQQLLKGPRSIRRMVMEIKFVPEVMSVKDLLVYFMKGGPTIACVVDEFGAVSGLITMEDILEEIFGEIEDEHDIEDFTEEQISDDEYLFSGRLELSYINEKYELELPEQTDYSTLSGYLIISMANIPDEGDEIELDGYRFIFEQMSEKKIEVVRVVRSEDLST